jgi:hypothetical protein
LDCGEPETLNQKLALLCDRWSSQQRLCMPSRRFTLGVPQHPRDLVHPVLSVKHLHIARRDPASRFLGDYEVAIGARGDLRQVTDDEHLMTLRHLGQR